jgi:acyl-coenzyme A synthetase/AMP-(fatty) acid ligase
LKAAKVRMVIAEPDLLRNVVGPALEYGIPEERTLAFGDDSMDGHQSWRTLFSHGESDWPRFNDLETSRNTTLARLFSSGTTGLPKAANLSHYNLIAEHRLFTEWTPTP